MASTSGDRGGTGVGKFGQLVVGPPGSGKSTYCAALARHLSALGRPSAVINLDPAAEGTPPYFSEDGEGGVCSGRCVCVFDSMSVSPGMRLSSKSREGEKERFGSDLRFPS